MRWQKAKLVLSILCLSFLLTQCSGSKFAGNDSTYTLILGDAQQNSYQELVRILRNKYQYQIERDVVYQNSGALVRTYWKERVPLSDNNTTFKPEFVETRITLQTRKKRGQGLYSIKFIGEYRALVPTGGGDKVYKAVPLTETAEKYFNTMANKLQDLLRGRIR